MIASIPEKLVQDKIPVFVWCQHADPFVIMFMILLIVLLCTVGFVVFMRRNEPYKRFEHLLNIILRFFRP